MKLMRACMYVCYVSSCMYVVLYVCYGMCACVMVNKLLLVMPHGSKAKMLLPY